MSRFYYDLHIHSCLSPCADDDNTPNNILGMASLAGLDIVALTDHNTAKNCPAFFAAAERYGIIPIAGMEFTTSEDIHAVCLFEHLSDAMDFDKSLDAYRIFIENRPEIFGNQLILDKDDSIIGEEKNLLINALQISIEDLPAIVEEFSGICFPAHIDRTSNGIIATLGDFPKTPDFPCVEFHNPDNIPTITQKYGLYDKTVIVSSDAHNLSDIRDGEHYFELDCDGSDPDFVRKRLFELLRRQNGGNFEGTFA